MSEQVLPPASWDCNYRTGLPLSGSCETPASIGAATPEDVAAAQLAAAADAAAKVAAHNESAGAHGLDLSVARQSSEMWVWDDSAGNVFIRWTWDATRDLVLKIEKVSSVSVNGLMNFSAFGPVANTTAIGGTPTISTSWQSAQDDIASYSTAANSRAGGNHGAYVTKVTKAAHGLTTAAIGKRYSDGTDNFVITHVPDAGYFYLLAAPKTINLDTAGTQYQPASASLTALDGQGNLTGCTYTLADAAVPSARGRVLSILVDGRTLNVGEIARCAKLELVEYHEAINVRGGYAYFVATGATAEWGSAAMGAMWKRTTKYTVFPWCQISVEDSTITTAEGIRFNNTPPIQHNPFLTTSGSEYRHIWLPGSGPLANKTFNGSAQTLDLNSPKYHVSNATIDYADTDTLIAGVPPDHIIEVIAPSNSTIDNWDRAHLAGTSPVYFDGVPATRLVQSDSGNQFQLGSAPKFYEYLRHDSTRLAAGTVIRSRGFRSWGLRPTETDFTRAVKTGTEWLLYVAWRTAGGAVTISLPDYVPPSRCQQNRALNGTLVSTAQNGAVEINQTADAGMVIVRLY